MQRQLPDARTCRTSTLTPLPHAPPPSPSTPCRCVLGDGLEAPLLAAINCPLNSMYNGGYRPIEVPLRKAASSDPRIKEHYGPLLARDVVYPEDFQGWSSRSKVAAAPWDKYVEAKGRVVGSGRSGDVTLPAGLGAAAALSAARQPAAQLGTASRATVALLEPLAPMAQVLPEAPPRTPPAAQPPLSPAKPAAPVGVTVLEYRVQPSPGVDHQLRLLQFAAPRHVAVRGSVRLPPTYLGPRRRVSISAGLRGVRPTLMLG